VAKIEKWPKILPICCYCDQHNKALKLKGPEALLVQSVEPVFLYLHFIVRPDARRQLDGFFQQSF
jgi:hypothetical protein